MGREDNLRHDVYDVLAEWLDTTDFTNLTLTSDEPDTTTDLMTDLTIVPEEQHLSLYFGGQTADIVLTTENWNLSPVMDTDHAVTTSKGFDIDDIAVPVIAVELKRGSGDSAYPNTDSIRARSRVARDVKRTFPFMGYFLFIDNSNIGQQKLYRAGREFDAAFITTQRASDTEIKESLIDHGIEPHLRRLDYLNILQ